MNANYQTNNDNPFFLLKQYNFADSDSYYEHATQRMMVFLNTWEADAAATYYGSTIPTDEASITNPLVARRRVLFARHDIFFWTKYPQPDGLPDRHTLITMDRYTHPTCIGNGTQTSVATVAGGTNLLFFPGSKYI